MKHATKILAALLLALAMVAGLMPGMGLTAYADNTETLLTTITPTSQTTYSETTSGVVTVSHNNDNYYGQYGWVWRRTVDTLTVSGCEGYTITKVIFKQNAKDPVTDSSAPFELHFVQGRRVECQENDDMDGVTSIEVYGYANKTAQTITASDVTATYGDTGKKIEATTSGDGALSYAVKSGDAVTIDPSSGALTIVKVGTATITVTAAETETYAAATKDVTVTVIKADASRDVPEKALPYTGQPQELVTAGTVSGGTLEYALGTDANTAPADGWSTEIPTATEAGTYYVWYRVLGDENHNDVDPACIVVTIAAPTSQETPAAALAAPESVSDYTLLASMKTSGNKAFKLKWTAVTGAEGYDVFFGPCGGQHELKKTVTGTSCKIGKLKKGNAYAAFVKAWRTENGQKVYIGQPSPDVHAVAGGKSNKYTNAKKISVKKKKLTVAVGGSKKIKASLKKLSNSRRYLNHTAKIRYYSSNRAVATVNAKGKVTGVAPGTCTVYAVAENGLRKGVKITVK